MVTWRQAIILYQFQTLAETLEILIWLETLYK